MLFLKKLAPAPLMIVLMLTLAVAGCASVSGSGEYNRSYDFASIERTAVVSVAGVGSQTAARDQIASMFNQALLGLGYSPIERSQINAVLEEQDFSRSALTRASGAAEAGRVLNVDSAVIITLPEFGDNMSMSAQMVDVEDGTILWSASGSARTGADMTRRAGQLIGAIGGGIIGAEVGSDGTTGAAVGGVGGAVGGGIIGDALSKQRQEQAAVLIDQLTLSLPER
ncbi:MAG: CsgG/HfaB family protein [Spiribacter sp.]|jgi:outer membrane lipoprotein SlyB|nr:CsgG/HfaB family protein [Spiribacter sp.]MDR9489998.1 CsgG/HfaB family protein [Spiribacter sp.]